MRVSLVAALCLLFAMPAMAQDAADGFTEEVRKAVTPEWTVQRVNDTITLSREVRVAVPNAPTSGEIEHYRVSVTVELVPYLDVAAQQAKFANARRDEREKWQKVSRLVCDGMEFSDHYEDGLCFRAKTPAQNRNVSAYRVARKVLLDVPRYHRGTSFAVTIHPHDLEPTEGSSGECAAVVQKVAALLTEYADRP